MSAPLVLRAPRGTRRGRARQLRADLQALRSRPVNSLAEAQAALRELMRIDLDLLALLAQTLPDLDPGD